MNQLRTFCIIIWTLSIQLVWSQNNSQNKDVFELNFSTAGLGSGMGSMQPTFRVNGTQYVYTFEQNSSYGEYWKKPDTICSGMFRQSSIDSIINLVKDIKDTLIYRTSTCMSGVVQYLIINTNTIDLRFQLHNANHPIAKKIVEILNSNIPPDKKRLLLFELDIN